MKILYNTKYGIKHIIKQEISYEKNEKVNNCTF